MNPEKMAQKFGFEPDDDAEKKLAKVMAYMSEHEEPDGDEEQQAVAEMAADLGVEEGPAKMTRMAAALRATRAPVSEVAALQGQIRTLSQRLNARDESDADAALSAFADQAIADGQWDASKRAALKTFARADMKAATSALLPKGTYTLRARIGVGGLTDPRRPSVNVPGNDGKRGVAFSQAVKAHMTSTGERDYMRASAAVAKAQPELASEYLNPSNG